MQDALSKDFGPEMIRYKPGRGGSGKLPYVSHGAVTKRLNDVDPDWYPEMVERWITETGGALHCVGGVMRLTVGGVTREEAGGPARLTTLADDLKNTYSDCLKRCAMRFGVALSLWESAEENDEDAQPAPDTPRPSSVQPRPAERAQQAPQPFSAGEYEDLIKKAWSFVRIDQYAEAIRVLRESRERMTTDQMDDTKEELKRMKAWTPEGATAP